LFAAGSITGDIQHTVDGLLPLTSRELLVNSRVAPRHVPG
jgi:hypothetical protein